MEVVERPEGDLDYDVGESVYQGRHSIRLLPLALITMTGCIGGRWVGCLIFFFRAGRSSSVLGLIINFPLGGGTPT